jgi:Na+-transporting NADH:ubiquinone oxidoreductase subunit C
MTIVVGGILAGASQFLAPAQKRSVELETKSQILGAVRNLVTVNEGDNILEIYNERISSLVVDYNGELVSKDEKGNDLIAEKVDVAKNYKKSAKDRLYPVFRLVNPQNKDQVEAYIVPVYGNGLWDRIWGYVALNSSLEEIVGATFDHKGETPGLGQRIATDEIQDRYVGKSIYDQQGNFVSVQMMKGEHGGGTSSIEYYKGDEHKVDGMSGATLTGNGVNNMLKNYLGAYQNYFEKIVKAEKQLP